MFICTLKKYNCQTIKYERGRSLFKNDESLMLNSGTVSTETKEKMKQYRASFLCTK